MSKNTLYNFIKNYIYTGTGKKQSFKGSALIPSITREGKPYFRFDLTCPKDISLIGEKLTLTLTAHHISVYQNQKDNNPFLSQYHYTADFLGNDESNYKLHIYYNSNDELATEPNLTIETDDGITLVNQEAFRESFLQLALFHTQQPLTELRRLQNQTITTLQHSINELEEKASKLSENLADNYATYQETTDKILIETKALSSLVPHNNYKKMYHITSLIKETLRVEHERSQHQGFQSSSSQSPDETEKAPAASKSKHKQKKRQKTKVKTDLASLVSALNLRFANLNQEDLETFAEEIIELHTDFYQISVLSEEKIKGTRLSIESLKQLQQLGLDIKNTGKELLFKLLSDGRFDLALKLKPYHYLLNTNDLNQALQDRNPELLDFLLTVGDFAINTQTVTIDKQHYTSPIYYCVNANSRKKSTAACLSVLIKHNASLLVPAKNGLPLAHIILSNIDHLLRATLQESPRINNANFYKQLIAALEQYLRTHTVSDLNLDQSIEHYKSKINQLTLFSQMESLKSTKNEKMPVDFNRTSSELDVLSEELRLHLFSQPQITALIQEIAQTAQPFLEKLAPTQKASVKRSFREVCAKGKTTEPQYNYDENDYEAITRHVQHYYEAQLAYLQKTSELVELSRKIKLTRRGKEKSKLITAQQLLANEISQIDQSKGIIAYLNKQSDLNKSSPIPASCVETIPNAEGTANEIIEQPQKIETKEEVVSSVNKDKRNSFFSARSPQSEQEPILDIMEKIDSHTCQ